MVCLRDADTLMRYEPLGEPSTGDTREKKPLILWFYMFANKDTQMLDSMFVDTRGGVHCTVNQPMFSILQTFSVLIL